LRTAYGYNGLGMPSLGFANNIDNVDARMLQQFIMDNVTPRKCLIVASGVNNHQEYVDLVKERLGEMLPVPEHDFTRTSTNYIGGEYRTWSETPATGITLTYESCPWNSEDLWATYVMEKLIGCNSAFASGTPGSGIMSRSS